MAIRRRSRSRSGSASRQAQTDDRHEMHITHSGTSCPWKTSHPPRPSASLPMHATSSGSMGPMLVEARLAVIPGDKRMTNTTWHPSCTKELTGLPHRSTSLAIPMVNIFIQVSTGSLWKAMSNLLQDRLSHYGLTRTGKLVMLTGNWPFPDILAGDRLAFRKATTRDWSRSVGVSARGNQAGSGR